MDIGRQPDASCDQRNCHDESQPIYDHATPIIVLLDIALVLGKAQDRRNVRITITDEFPPPCRPFRFGASRPNSDDAMYVIARLKRSEDQVTTFRHHHTDKGYRTGPTCKFHAAVGKYGRLVRLVMMRRAQLSLPRPSRSPIKNLQGFIAGWISAKLKKIHLSGLPVQKYIGDGGSRPGGPPIAEGLIAQRWPRPRRGARGVCRDQDPAGEQRAQLTPSGGGTASQGLAPFLF
jgi:hypothetical protein